MKNIKLCFVVFLLVIVALSQSEASNRYHFGYDKYLEVTITPEQSEFVAGSIATFTVTLRNKSKENIKIDYPTGQQWDMAIFYHGSQIFRWSNGYTWQKAPHYIPLRPGESRSQQLSWTSVNIHGQPLEQGEYSCVGVVTCSPKIRVSEKCRFRLTPPSVVAQEVIKTSLNQCFDIELPRFANNQELKWQIVYKYNDNRISNTFVKTNGNIVKMTFLPKRIGHVEFDLYAYPESLNQTVSLERRSYRIEVE